MKTKEVRTTEVCDGCGDKHPRGSLRRDGRDASLLYCDNCPKLTAEEVQEHLDGGFYCPFCADGKTQYSLSDYEAMENRVVAWGTCENGHTWREWYTMDSIVHERIMEEDEEGTSKMGYRERHREDKHGISKK